VYALSLNGAWTLLKADDPTAIAATVPGCVHTDLLANGLLDDPFYRDNELKQMWVGETDWTYRRTFSVTPDLLTHDRVLLCCYGLDTLATVSINGVPVGTAENMHRTCEFDVKSVLKEGENTIEIFLAAPMPFVRKMDAERGAMAGWVEPMRINSSAWIRKEPCNFGWDWGPKMVTSGIWRNIELIAFDTARIADVLITQTHETNRVQLTVNLQVERFNYDAVSALVTVSHDGHIVAQSDAIAIRDAAQTTLTIDNPALWWPNNMGSQPLYDVYVTLQEGDKTLDTYTQRIGLRTLTLERHADEWGESFYFACNGVPYFAKGANWIPGSPYPGEMQAVDYERLIKASADANMNMLRVWGGGIYEDDSFYALCDQYGITIWQDFMFACGTYPSFDEAFMANVKAEAEDVIRRLRHHACMALWCGNNEIEQGMPSPDWEASMSWEDYSRLFDHLLADLVRDLAPQTAYWPGSPHSPLGDRKNWANQECGDTHLWSVWHGKEPFEWYRTRLDRFCSEFGFQSFPQADVVYEFTKPEDRNITSYVMEHHQRSGIGNSTIIHYLLDWFRLSTSFEATLTLSQILQGMAMKYAIEHWRRNMPRSMGTLYWQLNDMWPAPSWSSLDWKGNWKALHHMARKFYAPLLVSGLENSTNHTVEIHTTSDLDVAQPVTVIYTITDAAGNRLEQGALEATIAPRTNQCLQTLDVSQHVAARSVRDVIVWLEMRANGETVSENLVLFSRPKHLELARPNISMAVRERDEVNNSYEVTLMADAVALYVWLELPRAQFSDNFFHLQPNQTRTIRVTHPEGMDDVAVAAALKVQSLVDTYL
jgi:beta-mannosidase